MSYFKAAEKARKLNERNRELGTGSTPESRRATRRAKELRENIRYPKRKMK